MYKKVLEWLCDDIVEARRPGIVLVNESDRNCMIGDNALTGDGKISNKEKKQQDVKTNW